MDGRVERCKLKCPHCDSLHSYQEVRFPVENDSGFWVVECDACQQDFYFPVKNPKESSFVKSHLIKRKLLDEERPEDCLGVKEAVRYNINLNKISHQFDYSSNAIYRCRHSGSSLEAQAEKALLNALNAIVQAHYEVTNVYLASRLPDFEYFVVTLDIDCSCGEKHSCAFYTKFSKNGDIPDNPSDYLLADISNTDFYGSLSRIASKSEIMGYLEKFLIRWNLFAKKIVIAAPFVGHQYLSKEDKLEIWNWLLTQLDPNKSIFVTRPATFKLYKSVLEEVDGLDPLLLAEFELENRLIAANTKKQDFHAKFFAGISDDCAEVLSGSANLVKGPSMENVSYSKISRDVFLKNYWKPLNLKRSLDDSSITYWVAGHEVNGKIETYQRKGACVKRASPSETSNGNRIL